VVVVVSWRRHLLCDVAFGGVASSSCRFAWQSCFGRGGGVVVVWWWKKVVVVESRGGQALVSLCDGVRWRSGQPCCLDALWVKGSGGGMQRKKNAAACT